MVRCCCLSWLRCCSFCRAWMWQWPLWVAGLGQPGFPQTRIIWVCLSGCCALPPVCLAPSSTMGVSVRLAGLPVCLHGCLVLGLVSWANPWVEIFVDVPLVERRVG